MPPQPETVRVLAAMPHAVAREGVRQFLSGDASIMVDAVATTGDETLAQARAYPRGVLLLDASIADPDAFEVMSRLRVEAPALRILFLLSTDAAALPLRALEFGAAGHIDGRAGRDVFLAAVRAVGRGERYLSPLVREALIERTGTARPQAGRLDAAESAVAGIATLSPREFQVLRLTARGLGTDAVATELAIAASTVRTFKSRLHGKLGLTNDVALARYAHDQGIE